MQQIDNRKLFGGVAIVGSNRNATKGRPPESSGSSSRSDEASFEDEADDCAADNQIRQISFEKPDTLTPANDETFANNGTAFQQNLNDFSLDQGDLSAAAEKLLATPFVLHNNSLSRREDTARMSAEFNQPSEAMHDAVTRFERNSVSAASEFPALLLAPRVANRQGAASTLFAGGADLKEE